MNSSEEKRILLVDEDLFLLDIYSRRLRGKGFDVEIAVNEEDAQKMIKEKGCGMVVLDVLIGDKPGLDVLARLKKENEASTCAFVVLTNSAHSKNSERALSLGADAYIVKAHNTPEEVAEELEKIYHSKRAN
jgi:DNA-binding response OmpR family regulator